MLEHMITGSATPPVPPTRLTEPVLVIEEFQCTLKKRKPNQSCDEMGLVAQLLQCAPAFFLLKLLDLYNDVLGTRVAPLSWHKPLFTMMAKTKQAKLVPDFYPIASISILQNDFSYVLLERIQPVLDRRQPKEQHGFRHKLNTGWKNTW